MINLKTIYEIKNLKVIFSINNKYLKAVEGIDIEIHQGEVVAIVGESGCGKSVTCKAMLGLLPYNAFMSADKLVYFKDDKEISINNLNQKEWLKIRGEEISLIFQDPNTSLNPVLTIGEQISEMFIYHKKMSKSEAKEKSIKLLEEIGIPNARKRYDAYPHEFSGGQKQRIMIAIAFSLNPRLILADEPTTALDVTIQKQILDLLMELKNKYNTSVVLITHDLGLVRRYADRMYVMYSGKIVEKGQAKDLLDNPSHPYTKGLLESVPTFHNKGENFNPIKGNVPSALDKPSGCFFHNRCPYTKEICKNYMPPLKEMKDKSVACWLGWNKDE